MKKLLFLLSFLPVSLWAFQKTTRPTTAPPSSQGDLRLTCKIISLPAQSDSLTLYEFGGLAAVPVKRVARQPDSSYVFLLPRGKARYYGVGFAENGLARVILGEEAAVTLWANAQYMDKARTVNSPANLSYERMRRRTEAFRLESETHRLAYRQAESDKNAALMEAIRDRFARLAKAETAYLDSLKKSDVLVWRSATLQIVPDPELANDAKGNVPPVDFWSREYFRYANLADRGYDEIPDVFDAFDAYAKVITPLGEAGARKAAEAQLAKVPAGSPAYRLALGGLLNGFKTAQSPLYPVFAEQYINLYRSKNRGEIGRVEYELRRAGAFTPGMKAPDLSGLTPDSQSVALAQFKGSYVMIDFWASWCGPCRRENPNVKALYDKYHAKGFNILGVSLDRERTAWLKAIETDKLNWAHISDLKGWNSEHAKLYGVTSIPQTVLLDQEGRIVARNLRGDELKMKLAAIFGE